MAPRPADTYAGYHPLKRTYRLRVPASRILYVPEARGGLPPGPHVLYAPGMRFPPRTRTCRAPWHGRFRHGTVRCLTPIYRAPWHRRFLATYDAYPSYIQRCDAARYFAAHKYGGVYADLDVECSKPFAPAIGDARAVFSFKQGTNMSRGLVNAIFASEAGHPLWEIVFELLRNRSAAGAAAASHVDVIQSTGPALLRAAVLQLDETGRLGPLGVKLLDSSVWHPTMPEQKHGRDTSEATKAMIDASSCVHHFVSSWMTHDKQAHTSTLEERKVAGTPVVPKAQSFRTTNEWRSFELEKSAAKGRGGHNGRGRGRAAARAPTAADYAAAAAAPRRDASAAAAAPRYDTSAFAADKSRKAKEARGGDAGRMIFGDAEGADEDV